MADGFLVERTIWIVPVSGGYEARWHDGRVLAFHKHQSTLNYIVRRDAPNTRVWAIAVLVDPDKRQPNRALRKRR